MSLIIGPTRRSTSFNGCILRTGTCVRRIPLFPLPFVLHGNRNNRGRRDTSVQIRVCNWMHFARVVGHSGLGSGNSVGRESDCARVCRKATSGTACQASITRSSEKNLYTNSSRLGSAVIFRPSRVNCKRIRARSVRAPPLHGGLLRGN
jgi:hypothetical protein